MITEAEVMANSLFNMFAGIITNRRIPLSANRKPFYHGIPEIEQAVHSMTSCTFIGTPATLAPALSAFAKKHKAREIMLSNNIYEDSKRLRAFELIAETFRIINSD